MNKGGSACYTESMRVAAILMICLGVVAVSTAGAQTRKPPPKKAPVTTKKAPASIVPLAKVTADIVCPTKLGVGVATTREFCDVLTSRESKDGILITIPPHRGPVTLTFDLHNRHTYSAELIRTKQAYRKYTATVGVLTMDNTLIDRAVIQSEFRTDNDLFDRISGGVGPGGVKAVMPAGDEKITIELPETVEDQVSILGEKLTVVRPDGTDNFSAPGRPIATISNVEIEYRPGPAKKTPPKKP